MEFIDRIIRLFENPSTTQVVKTIFYILGIILFFYIPRWVKAIRKFIQQILDALQEVKDNQEELHINQQSSDTAIEKVIANGKGTAYAEYREATKDVLRKELNQRKINESYKAAQVEKRKFKLAKLFWPFGLLLILGTYFII